MAETVGFPTNGVGASGHLVLPPGGSGPGVIMVQEWWGVEESLKANAERLAAAGFVVLIPDLYHGENVLPSHDEMDKAAELMNAMPPERAAADMSGAVDFLGLHPGVTGDGAGVVGFCMGGMLAWILAANRPDRIKAAVPFYGYPSGPMEPDWTGLQAVVRAHMAENDDFFGPTGALELERKLQDMGKDVQVTVHAGTGHAFMGPHNALGTHDETLAEKIWPEVAAFLHEQLG